MIDKIIFIFSFLLMFVAYSLHLIIKESYGIKVFYPFTSLAYVGFIYAYTLKLKGSRYKTITQIVLATAISNFIDEIFFDNSTHTIAEYINFMIIIIVAFSNEYRRNKRVK